VFTDFPPETIYAYPNADEFGHEQALARLTAAPHRPLIGPTAVYIHVPFCLSLCHFCGFLKSTDIRKDTLTRYLETVKREIVLVADYLGARGTTIDAIYFGGGTASMLSSAQVATLIEELDRVFTIRSSAEWSFEGECRTLLKTGFLEDLAAMGFHRISYGVQTLDEGAREVLNLKPSVDDLASLAAQAGRMFEDVTVDFIFGWTGQTVDQVSADTQRLVQRIAPLSVEVFQFEKSDSSPHLLQALYRAGLRDPSVHELQAQRDVVARVLSESGYLPQGFTFFRRQDQQPSPRSTSYLGCFYGYDNANVLGFGRGAQSFYGGLMWAFGLTEEHHEAVVEGGKFPVSVFGAYEDWEREAVSWPRRGWIDKFVVEAVRIPDYRSKLSVLEERGYVRDCGDRISLTSEGERWVPSLIFELLPDSQKRLYHRDFEFNAAGRKLALPTVPG
jgi:oxygen-independent coproporphyrinogen-3 oxidase